MTKLIIWTASNPLRIKNAIGTVLHNCGAEFVSVGLGNKIPDMNNGDVVLAMGQKTLDIIQNAGMVPKNRKIGSMRGTEIKLHSGKCSLFFSYDPGLIEIDSGRKPEIQWDARLCLRRLLNNSIAPTLGEYNYTTNYTKEIEYIRKMYKTTNKAVGISVDLETVGLDPWAEDVFIVSISVTVKEGRSAVIRFKSAVDPLQPAIIKVDVEDPYIVPINTKLLDQIRWLLSTNKASLKGANFKFDMTWMRRHWGIGDYSNYKMDTTMVGSLLDENRCVGLGTLLLTKDLRWVVSESVKVGDELLGFDEEVPNPKCHRSLRNSVVLSTEIIEKKKVGIYLSNGVYIEVSSNHQFLKKKSKNGGTYCWAMAKNLEVGNRLRTITDNPKHLNGCTSEYDRGRLSGFLDGDGSCHKVNESGSWALTWGQKPHVAHEDMKRIFGNLGVLYREHDDAINVCKTVSARGVWYSLHGMITLKPLRLMEKEPWVDGSMPREPEPVIITKIKQLGLGKVVAIETSTHTFIAEGIASHNSNSLNNHTKLYTDNLGGYDDIFNKTQNKARMDLVSDADLLPYAGGDTDACLRVSTSMRKSLAKDKELRNFYIKLLHPASKAFEVLESRGMVVDVAQYEVLRHQVQNKIEETSESFLAKVPQRIKRKYSTNLSPTRAALLNDFLFSNPKYLPGALGLKALMKTPKSGKPSTAMEHIELLEKKNPKEVGNIIELLRDYNSATKTMSTYIVGFLKHLRTDGRFHPTYHLYKGASADKDVVGTNTGRLSATNPAVQTTPKHTVWAKPLRSVYVPPPGHVIVNVDYSQGELRVMACLSNETNMLDAYKKGIDMHLVTGASVYGIELEKALAMKKAGDPKIKEIRQGGKAGNFGLIYGISPEGFQIYARKTYGVTLSLDESKKFKDIFFEQNPNILKYHDDQFKFAHKHGYVRSPLGRIRHLPLINSKDGYIASKQERQSINSPTQSVLSDLGIFAIAELHRLHPQLWVCGFTHDAITSYVPEDNIDLWVNRIKGVMENLPIKETFGWEPQIPFTVDVEIGYKNMGDMVEWEG